LRLFLPAFFSHLFSQGNPFKKPSRPHFSPSGGGEGWFFMPCQSEFLFLLVFFSSIDLWQLSRVNLTRGEVRVEAGRKQKKRFVGKNKKKNEVQKKHLHFSP